MPALHTFGCSITQGFALPDLVRPILDSRGDPIPEDQLPEQGRDFHWEDIHVYAPSIHAWPAVLAEKLAVPVNNHARRGACFQQIARQCAVNLNTIRSEDTVVVMWTYMSRLSLQWPARTTVPFCNVVDTAKSWRTMILGFNNFFGLDRARIDDPQDQLIQQYIHDSTRYTYLDPLGIYDRYYNSLVLQVTVDGLLRSTGARVIHLSVETEPLLAQLELARQDLPKSLRSPYVIPDPADWYQITVDHDSCRIIHDPSIPPAENDMHPSIEHHRRFAEHIQNLYFS